ncbi:hypothetical protein BHJ80_15560 [Escherichia coli]|nr:hypothetical protein BHJ80_15560 [Escherichia coli]
MPEADGAATLQQHGKAINTCCTNNYWNSPEERQNLAATIPGLIPNNQTIPTHHLKIHLITRFWWQIITLISFIQGKKCYTQLRKLSAFTSLYEQFAYKM